MQGFKSFADKIKLNFNKGLTAVVGPNGSGKSNISDAVRWVLGEQSARTLRGNKMEDVIFAGTQHRKPVGFAQVSLTIDNSDKSLPLDFSEVTVTRRVYRSGESEYYVNKTQCRLKDIHELFMNTGVGKEGYSIIGQGRIDDILSNRSADRRAIFEEAAGITKYKARKIDAERKLESTKQNLLRIEDIILELKSQIEPLREQAEKARKYLEMSAELKELQVGLYLDSIQKLQEKIDELEQLFSNVWQNIQQENKRLEEKKRENREKTEKLDKLKKNLELVKDELVNWSRETDRLENQIKICEEKVKSLESSKVTYAADIKETKNRRSAIEADIDKKGMRLAALSRDKYNFLNMLKEAEEQLALIVSQLDEGERRIEMMKQDVMDKLDELSESRIRLNSLKNEREAFLNRLQKVKAEIQKVMLARDMERMQLEEAKNSLRTQRDSLALKKQTVQEKEKALREGKKQLEKLRNEQTNVLRGLQTAKSRCKVLRDMENNFEGYSNSVRAVLRACRENPDFGAGIYGALAQLIHVKERFESAIEVALGAALQNIVTKDEYTARDAIQYLKENHLGRATFLPITSIKPRELDKDTIDRLRTEKGFLGTASSMINCQPCYKNIIVYCIIINGYDLVINIAWYHTTWCNALRAFRTA
jgi:chromosome segregation protein